MHIDHRFVIELLLPDGTAVGRSDLEPDWIPAIECARLRGLQRHGVWAAESAAVRRVEPLWSDERGVPFARGFRVHLADGRGTEWNEDFDLSYFSGPAGAAADALVEQETVPRDRQVLYRLLALDASPGQPEPRASSGLVVEEVVVPLPLVEKPLESLRSSSISSGDDPADELEVFVSDAVMDEAGRLAVDAGDLEAGGVLIGHLVRDSSGGAPALEVTALIAARHVVSEVTKLTFTSDTWTDVRNALGVRGRGESIVGWIHTHPHAAWCRRKGCTTEAQERCASALGFMSAEDVDLHRTVFPRAYSVALVMTHSITGVRPRLFGWRSGRVQPVGFRILTAHSGG